MNRKCPPRNSTLQLSTPYADPEPPNSLLPKFPNFFNNGLWLGSIYRRPTSYSKDTWTGEKYDRLSQQQLGFLLQRWS